ncbi:hypothetical protein EMIT0P395_20170 [Pseudomonas sp. IT-P395]
MSLALQEKRCDGSLNGYRSQGSEFVFEPISVRDDYVPARDVRKAGRGRGGHLPYDHPH